MPLSRTGEHGDWSGDPEPFGLHMLGGGDEGVPVWADFDTDTRPNQGAGRGGGVHAPKC